MYTMIVSLHILSCAYYAFVNNMMSMSRGISLEDLDMISVNTNHYSRVKWIVCFK